MLFVIDYDYGALGTVMYLLHRQPLAVRATLLLPRRVFALHQGRLPVASRPYESLRDILDAAEAIRPDVVCLFSGYLFTSQGLLTLGALRELVDTLRRRGCKVATSDPYLGTFPRIAEADVPAGSGALSGLLDSPLARIPGVRGLLSRALMAYYRAKVGREVREVGEILRDVTHIYPVPTGFADAGAPKPHAFFNPLYIRGEDELRANSAQVAAGMLPRGPRWMFVLAQFDLVFQEAKHGRRRFVELVAAKIREALALGKHPVFVGPAAVSEEVARHFAPDAGVVFMPSSSFAEFEQRLLDAEAVFYWQILSTSAFFRLWNGLPVFFFDRGHNAHVLAPLGEAALKYYYLGGPPIYLDIDKPLDAQALQAHAAGFREAARESRRRLAGLPDPGQMVAAIAAGY